MNIWKERRGARLPLRNLHVFNPAGFVSFGLPVGDILSFKRDIPAIVSRISRDLFLADLDAHEQRINATIAEDFSRELYAASIWTSPHGIAAE